MTSLKKTDDVLEEVRARREAQEREWGQSSHPFSFWVTILMEEVGELSETILNDNKREMRDEALDVAAVAVALIEDSL